MTTLHSSALGAVGIARETTHGVPADIANAYWLVVETNPDLQDAIAQIADEGLRNSMVKVHGHTQTTKSTSTKVDTKGRLSGVAFGLGAIVGDVDTAPSGGDWEHTIGLLGTGNTPSYTLFYVGENGVRAYPGQRAASLSIAWAAGELASTSLSMIGFPAVDLEGTPTVAYDSRDVPAPGWNTVTRFIHAATVATPATGTSSAHGTSVTLAVDESVTVSCEGTDFTATVVAGTYANAGAQASQLQTAIRAADAVFADVTVVNSGGLLTFTSPSGVNFEVEANSLAGAVAATGGVRSTTSTIADVESGSIDIAREGAEALHLSTGTQGPAAIVIGAITVSGKLTVMFDADLFDAFLASEAKELEVTITTPHGQAVISIPSARITNGPINRGATVVKLDLEFTAEGADGATGYTPIEAVVTCGAPIVG